VRAVLISPNPASNAGGVERFCVLLASVLQSAGWTTSLVGPDGAVPPALARIGLSPSLQALSATRGARRASADLVISNGFLGGPTGGRRIHVFHGTMVVHALKDVTSSRRYRLRQAVGGALPEVLCGRGAKVVAVSTSTASEVRRVYRQGVDAVIPNGVDTELFSPGDRATARARLRLDREERYALFVGRFEQLKGADLLPEACRRAGFKLLVAGPSAPPSAISLGTLAPADLGDGYRAANCVVLPSRYEACSFVVLEALASGVPLITTAVGGMEDFLSVCPSYSPFIVRPDLDSVTGALCRVGAFDSAEVLAEARAYVERYNGFEVFARRWLELIAEVVND
jgi:glycosyltransferase involved in cell wall biosynthesis